MKIKAFEPELPSTSSLIQKAEKKLGPCIKTVFGKDIRFLVTAAVIDEVDSTVKIEFTLPCAFDNKHFVWHFSIPALTEEFCQEHSDNK